MKYKINDYELIYKVRENDEDSKDFLYKKYYPIIHHLANSFYQANKYYGYDFEDFLQEANIAFYKALSSFNERENTLFYTFVVICIKRKLLSFCKRITNRNNNYSSLECLSLNEIDVEDKRVDVNSLFNNIEIEKTIKDFIYSLPFEKACIFELKYNGFTYREISTLLDMPISSLEFKYRSSLKKIRKILKDYTNKKNIYCKEAI